MRKLFCANVISIFVAAQLCKWESLRDIHYQIEAHDSLQDMFGCTVSPSQLSRRINDVPSQYVESIFHSLLSQIQQKAAQRGNLPSQKTFIVDSTNIRLPHQMADWTHVTQFRSGIKVHTRLVVHKNGDVYPDRIVPSTGNVSDYEGSDLLVVEPDATYLMDRGYVSNRRMDEWTEKNVRFIIRLHDRHVLKQVVEEKETPAGDPGVLRDAIVYMGSENHRMAHPVRLVEFLDDQQRVYRVASTRFDLSAREIADLYRRRWQIELFFKWMKQHLKLGKLYGYKPNSAA